ncbi:MFS transporter [Leifsonia aquatica]|jgi:MFS family permease|uniref:Transporter, major facilitator family protein n=2 Tax=Leifsonia aquatica TaxID=144185 RepID=U2RSM4_LEIAQ|nr:MFS transporter [Leifsonia aquatica]ERK71826.1 transporter, major facilitator family protein [Leifsonia aquatica ATCC 14665]MBB2967850.1 MFS family permease [Leifsonia aquatica]
MSDTLAPEPRSSTPEPDGPVKKKGNVVLEPAEPGTSPILIRGRSSRRYLTWYTILTIAISAVWGAVLGILLPNHVQILEFGQWFTGSDAGLDLQKLTLLQQAVDAGTTTANAAQAHQLELLKGFNSARAQSLAIITSIGVVLTMLIQPVVGVLADRTRSRWGRRAPWILFGSLIGALLLVLMRFSPTLVVLAIVYMFAQAFINAAVGPLATTVADRMPENRRGTASALGGFGNFFGGLLGGLAAGSLFAVLGLDIYFIVAAFVAFAGVMFVLFAKDRSSKNLLVPKMNWRSFFVGFTIALRSRDFRWVWVARILLSFGYTVSTALSLYMLQSYIRPALSQTQATQLAPLLTLVGVPVTIIALFIAGRLSDKLGKRRIFVIISSVLMAFSMLIPIVSPTILGLFLQAVVGGIAFGIYLPVDQALFIDVLPDEKAAGRDLGVAGLGSNLGQALGPILAGAVVATTGGYVGVWIAAFGLVLLAGVALFPLKGIK